MTIQELWEDYCIKKIDGLTFSTHNPEEFIRALEHAFVYGAHYLYEDLGLGSMADDRGFPAEGERIANAEGKRLEIFSAMAELGE